MPKEKSFNGNTEKKRQNQYNLRKKNNNANSPKYSEIEETLPVVYLQQEIEKATINNAGTYLYVDILNMYTPYFSCYY